MGKGRGSVCGKPVDQSKQAAPVPAPKPAETPAEKPTTQAPASTEQETSGTPEVAKVEASPVTNPQTAVVAKQSSAMAVKIYVIFYSMYGHTHTLAKSIKEGIDSVEGVEGVLFQVPETLPEEVLQKMHAPPKPDVPVIDRDDLPNADGFVFGIPTRFGMMSAQMKAFFDSTGQHWQSGALVGKPASIFVSTATQNGGQETTALTAVTQLVHHGMIFVPPGYSYGGTMFDLEAAHAGGPWGAGTFAGPTGAAQPTEHDLGFAKHQGAHLAKITKKLAAA